jgi:putative addiction module component (TIGR02574 family)
MMRYPFAMSFTEVLAELPALTVAERQLLIRRALDLDEPALPPEDDALVDQRLEEHRRNPNSAVPLDEMKSRLRSRFAK